MKQATRPINQTAGRVIEKHFERYRGRPEIAADLGELSKANEWLRWCLRESDLLGSDERDRFYLAVTEGLWPDGYGEEAFGDTAFELLVQFARYYGACRVTRRVLRLVRGHSFALESDPIELLDLARAVTDECRRRYRPHLPPLGRPAEILAPPLARDDAIRVALAYWSARYDEETGETGGQSSDETEDDILAEPCETGAAKRRLVHDLREGYRLAPPRGRKARRAEAARYRSNAAVALAAALDVYRREGLGWDGVVSERAQRLARFVGVTPRKAFRYLYYLARHSRDA